MNYAQLTYQVSQQRDISRVQTFIQNHAEDYLDDETGLLDAEALAARALQEFGIAMEVARELVAALDNAPLRIAQ